MFGDKRFQLLNEFKQEYPTVQKRNQFIVQHKKKAFQYLREWKIQQIQAKKQVPIQEPKRDTSNSRD